MAVLERDPMVAVATVEGDGEVVELDALRLGGVAASLLDLPDQIRVHVAPPVWLNHPVQSVLFGPRKTSGAAAGMYLRRPSRNQYRQL
jgi:hypothetical protein